MRLRNKLFFILEKEVFLINRPENLIAGYSKRPFRAPSSNFIG